MHLKNGFNRQLVRIFSFVIMFLIFTSSVITVNAMSRDFYVVDGENTYAVTIMNTDTDNILKRAGIELGRNDSVIKDEKNGIITVKRAFSVNITADGATNKMIFTDGNVGYAIKEANIQIGKSDIVTPPITTALKPDMHINILRMHEITVDVDGDSHVINVPNGTVEEALNYSGFGLGSEDVINVKKNASVYDGMKIVIQRVGYHESTVKEIIPYNTYERETNKLPKGETQVQTEGVNGERIIKNREKVVDGVVTERVEISNKIEVEPVNKIILVGTGSTNTLSNSVKSKTSSSSNNTSASIVGNKLIDQYGNEVSYKSVITGSCTAYTKDREDAVTALGWKPKYGYVAVDPSVIPYGSKLYICSPDGSFVYGYAVAADTGGAMLSGKRLADLYFETEYECWEFGVRNLSIYILEYGS